METAAHRPARSGPNFTSTATEPRASQPPAAESAILPSKIEPFYTLNEASARLNLKYWHLLRMSRRGELRLYKAGSGRNRVLLSEVMEAIRRSSEQELTADLGNVTDLTGAGRA